MSDLTQWIVCICGIFIAIQSLECSRFLQKIYKHQTQNDEINKQILMRLTQHINFIHSLEGPLHRFLAKEKS